MTGQGAAFPPVCGSQSRRVPSSLPVTRQEPSGLKAQHVTRPLWAVIVRSSAPDSRTGDRVRSHGAAPAAERRAYSPASSAGTGSASHCSRL